MEHRLRDVLMRKSVPDLDQLASDELDIDPFQTLLGLQGNADLIAAARKPVALLIWVLGAGWALEVVVEAILLEI